MTKLSIKVNGEELKDVTGFSYLEGVSKFRVVRQIGDEVTHDDYDTRSIDINIDGEHVDYNMHVMCRYLDSDTTFIGVVGRYSCVSIKDDGTLKLLDDDLSWIDLKVRAYEVDRVREIANNGMGSLYVAVGESGLGKIYDRTIEEDRY